MKAIAVRNGSLHDIDLPIPQPGPRDLQVKVHAVSVNPVDHKVRAGTPEHDTNKVLGWDVAGTVTAVGSAASLFKVGDEVYYAGSIVRQGANSEYHVVDERIVGRKPRSLNFAQAAALPLTSITAWEALFDRLGIDRNGAHRGKRLLVIGGAGGVGSIAIQLASKLAGLTVIATASRPESADWARLLGAQHVVDHNADLPAQMATLDMPAVDFILCLNEIDQHFPAMANLIAPQGKICSILGPKGALALEPLFSKSATLVFELMFTRSMFGTADMQAQHVLLNEVADLVDAGTLVETVGAQFGTINAENISRAHAALEGRRTIGKIVLEGFQA